MASKDQIKKLQQEIERLEFIKDFQQEFIAELELETRKDLAKKSLPESLSKEIEQKKRDILKNNGSTNASGSQDKLSVKK